MSGIEGSMDTVLGELSRSGGYALLLGVVILGLFYLAQRWMDSTTKRAAEEKAEADAQHKDELSREVRNAEAYRETTNRMTEVVQGNTVAITTLIETVRPMQDTLTRIDKHLGGKE